MRLLLKIWIKLKCEYARRVGWIHSLKTEMAFICDKTADDLKSLKYKQDKLGFFPWDYQRDSITTFNIGGDCNSINRCWQAWYECQGIDGYLVTFLHKPLSKPDFKI